MSTTNLKPCRTNNIIHRIHINLLLYCSKKFYKFKQVLNNLLYNDFIVNIYIQLDWEQVFTTY